MVEARYPVDARQKRTTTGPWTATVDGFEHWIYTHPTHTPEERIECWLSLLDRFCGKTIDWKGLDDARASLWQRQTHLFASPFSVIPYGIAQIGALHLWLQHKKDPDRALKNYRQALALGGTRPLPELFQAMGLKFDFSAKTIEPLVAAVRDEVAATPG